MKSCCYCNRRTNTTRPECYQCRNLIKTRERDAMQRSVGRFVAEAVVKRILNTEGCL